MATEGTSLITSKSFRVGVWYALAKTPMFKKIERGKYQVVQGVAEEFLDYMERADV